MPKSSSTPVARMAPPALVQSLQLGFEALAVSLAAFASVQVLLWLLLDFDVIGEAFRNDQVVADLMKTTLALAVAASLMLALGPRRRT